MYILIQGNTKNERNYQEHTRRETKILFYLLLETKALNMYIVYQYFHINQRIFFFLMVFQGRAGGAKFKFS